MKLNLLICIGIQIIIFATCIDSASFHELIVKKVRTALTIGISSSFAAVNLHVPEINSIVISF